MVGWKHELGKIVLGSSGIGEKHWETPHFILAGITTNELFQAIDMVIDMKHKGVLGKPCPDCVDETVSMKVVRIIQGYVNVVNKMVWRK